MPIRDINDYASARSARRAVDDPNRNKPYLTSPTADARSEACAPATTCIATQKYTAEPGMGRGVPMT
jgi:hypothetical protein